jgi:hypothetical protein
VIVAFRRHTLLPLDDCLYALQPTIPHLARSSLHRYLQLLGCSRLPQVEGEASPKRKFKVYTIGYFHIDIADARPRAHRQFEDRRPRVPSQARQDAQRSRAEGCSLDRLVAAGASISKRGDRRVRTLLCAAANVMLTRYKD